MFLRLGVETDRSQRHARAERRSRRCDSTGYEPTHRHSRVGYAVEVHQNRGHGAMRRGQTGPRPPTCRRLGGKIAGARRRRCGRTRRAPARLICPRYPQRPSGFFNRAQTNRPRRKFPKTSGQRSQPPAFAGSPEPRPRRYSPVRSLSLTCSSTGDNCPHSQPPPRQ